MDEAQRRYIEDFGVLFGGFGMPRMVGRVLGTLLISDPPERSAEELANLPQGRRAARQPLAALASLGGRITFPRPEALPQDGLRAGRGARAEDSRRGAKGAGAARGGRQ